MPELSTAQMNRRFQCVSISAACYVTQFNTVLEAIMVKRKTPPHRRKKHLCADVRIPANVTADSGNRDRWRFFARRRPK
jgi:hypothetical protein